MKDPERILAKRIETLEFWLQQVHDRLQRLIGGEANLAWLQRCAADEELFEDRMRLLREALRVFDALAAIPGAPKPEP
ncbi:MAG TPA: hypothetical protein VKV96_03610 [Roseiarcus sp.]|nr:hypothetical protein [Roseiarcus sp.]